MKPVILLTPNIDSQSKTIYSIRYHIESAYSEAVFMAGGLPVICAKNDPDSYADQMDGLILTGGADLDPACYGETQKSETVKCNKCRDELELALYRAFAKRRKPILGICRGIQVINVAEGGTLWQDLCTQQDWYCHQKNQDPQIHRLKSQKGSIIHQLFGEVFYTNTHHHQAIRNLAEGFRLTAQADDGVIEAIEHQARPILGVQWHPERLIKERNHPLRYDSIELKEMLPLFCYYVALYNNQREPMSRNATNHSDK